MLLYVMEKKSFVYTTCGGCVGVVVCGGLCAGLCAQGLCALCAQRRMVVRKVVRGCAQNLDQSLVRLKRHKAFALFMPPLFERHNVHNPCAKFISLIFFC